MFTKKFLRGGEVMVSDSKTIAQHLGLTYWIWGGLIAVLAVAILFGSYSLAWKVPNRTPEDCPPTAPRSRI